jgi:hypothetical protein
MPRSGGQWTDSQIIGSGFARSPSIAVNAVGDIEVAATGVDGNVYVNTHRGDFWSGWVSVGGPFATSPRLVADPDHRLELFAMGNDGRVWNVPRTVAR